MKQTFLLIILLLFCFALNISAQTDKKKSFEVYGFVMTDAGYNVKTINPDWYDAFRVTKLPTYDGQFAPNGKLFYSVRQTKFGVKTSIPTALGDFTTKFEFDLFGVGDRVGQTDIRLRHAYGQLGHFGAGQTNSAYMDVDVFPNSLEYWGPTGMIFFRNIQIRYMPLMTKNHDLTIALENPGASADPGDLGSLIDIANVKALYNVPDLTGHYRYTDKWGYLQVGGIVGSIKWQDLNPTAIGINNMSGNAIRWGGTLSTNINIGKAILRLQGIYGEGVQNYQNDAPVDVGIQTDPANTTEPIKGIPLPVWGVTGFIDFNWSKKFSSSIGYSVEKIKNSNGQADDAFKQGQYALVNLLYYPVDNFTAGIEFLYGRRDSKNGYWSDNQQVRVAFKYNFSHVINF